MARQIDEFRAAWESLARTHELDGWRSIAITSPRGCVLRAGARKPGNEESVLAHFPAASLPAAERLPEGQGFSVERVDLYGDGATWVALSRKPTGGSDLFGAMACDVAGALDEEPAADSQRLLKVFLGRVRAWQEFMRKGSQPLSAEAEVGLVGELTALGSIIDAGVPADIAAGAWVGPLGGLRDFEIGTGGMEIKSTLSANGFPARIGSLDQLDDSVRQPLFVAGVRLRQADAGRGLPDCVERLRDIVRGDAEAERALSERLLSAGYFDGHAEQYSRRFLHVETRVVEVVEGFPRLTPGRVPQGIVRAAYEIDLDRAPSSDVGFGLALKKLGAL